MNKLFRGILFLVFVSITITHPVFAASPVVVQRVFVNGDENRYPIDPRVVSRADGGNFIVAGSSAGGWAAKFDAQGKMLWKYERKFPYLDPKPYPDPDFLGVAAMADGTTYLCSNVPHPIKDHPPTALLTHLDANGQLMAERIFWPSNNNEIKNPIVQATFEGCTAWEDGFVVFGQILEKNGTVDNILGTPVSKIYYGVIKFDSTGKIQWERYIPRLGDASSPFTPQSLTLMAIGDKLFFSVVHNAVVKNTDPITTDVAVLTDTGEVSAKINMLGWLRLVHPNANSKQIQLLGSKNNLVLIALDQDLQEQHRVETNSSLRPNIIFENLDGNLVAFGTNFHSFGRRYNLAMLHTDQNLNDKQIIEFYDPGIDDPGVMGAAVPTGAGDGFIVAKYAWKAKPGVLGFLQKDSVPDDFVRGMVIEIIKFK